MFVVMPTSQPDEHDTDLQRRRVEAEIAKLNAEADRLTQAGLDEAEKNKLLAEVEKLQAETEELKNRWRKLSEAAKLLGALLIGVGGAVAAVTTYQVTELKTQIALRDKEKTTAELERLKQEKEQLAEDIKRLSDAKNALEEENRKAALATAAMGSAGQVLIDVVNSSAVAEKPDVKAAAKSFDATLRKADATLAASAYSPLFIVYAASKEQEEMARALSSRLAKEGMRAMKLRTLAKASAAPHSTEVRYFRYPEDRDEAKRILDSAMRLGVKAGRISYVADPDISRPRYFEVRLSVDAF